MEEVLVEMFTEPSPPPTERVEEILIVTPVYGEQQQIDGYFRITWDSACAHMMAWMPVQPQEQIRGLDSLMILLSFVMLALICTRLCAQKPRPMIAHVVDDAARQHSHTKQEIIHV